MRIAALIIIACGLVLTMARPSHAAERYLDEVFPTVTVTSNIAYGQAIDEFGQLETLRLDVYTPTGDTETNRPAIIWVHGGGFTSGDKSSVTIAGLANTFAKRGYVTASINYRLREAGFPPAETAQVVADAQHDAQAAIRWFRANAGTLGIDPDRISIGGYSAGAVTSLHVTYRPDDPGDSGNPGYPSNVSAVISISGAMNDAFMDAGEPPVMLVHGTNDATVPYAEALQVVARAQEVGVPSELHSLQGVGHDKFGQHTDDIINWSSAFLYQYVIIAGEPVGGVAELANVELAPAREAASRPWGVVALGAVVALSGGAAGAWALRRRRWTGGRA